MRVLVTGGAGYIGSHMVEMLDRAGHDVTILDNLSNGHRDAVLAGRLVVGDLGDTGLLENLMDSGNFDAVMHFASLIQVGESMQQPGRYYSNNLGCTLNLLDAMARHGVQQLVFSSTAAIFGEPRYTPVDEVHPRCPINPYGASKHMVEQVLPDYDRAYGLRSVCLRYFNAAGADPACRLGERHEPETHLVPLVLQAASGRRGPIKVFGRDYDTPDGTCIRDYIHVADLCQAHLKALDRLAIGMPGGAFNLGNGSGFSVQEVIAAAERVTGRPIASIDAPRRPGDPARLVAEAKLARAELGWQPDYPELETIIAHAWAWEARVAGLRS